MPVLFAVLAAATAGGPRCFIDPVYNESEVVTGPQPWCTVPTRTHTHGHAHHPLGRFTHTHHMCAVTSVALPGAHTHTHTHTDSPQRAGGRGGGWRSLRPRQVVVYSDIQYGSAFNNATRRVEPLLLDAYSPPLTDGRKKR